MARLELAVSGGAIAMVVVAGIIFLLGWIALVRERVTAVNFSFFILTWCAAIWLGATAMGMMSTSAATAWMYARIAYIGICAIPAAVFQFSAALAGPLRPRRHTLAATWIASLAFIPLFTLTPFLLTGVWQYSWGYYPRLGIASVAFLLFFCVALVASLHILRAALRTEMTVQQQKRITAFLAALAVGYVGSIDYLPSFGVSIYPIGHIAVLGFIALATRAFVRFRFYDFTPSYLADQLMESVQGGVIVVDTTGAIQLINPAGAELLGARAETLTGTDLRSLLHLDRLPATDSRTFVRGGRARNRTMTWRRRDGSSVEVSISATRLRDRDQHPVGILYVLQDLTERRRAERHEFAANHDALTGLPNRAYFARRFETTMGEIAESGRTPAVLFLDLDGFKEINDQHGHAVGDRLLQLVASRLRNALRDEDVLARHGGDEFVAFVALRHPADGGVVANKLVSILRKEPFTVDNRILNVSASVGIALAPRDGTELDPLVKAADEAMYREKRKAQPRATREQTDRASASPFVIESRA